jgi:hypothetical protein
MIELIVRMEANEAVAYLLYQAARDGMIESTEDAKAVWKELISIAAMDVPENLAKRNKSG